VLQLLSFLLHLAEILAVTPARTHTRTHLFAGYLLFFLDFST